MLSTAQWFEVWFKTDQIARPQRAMTACNRAEMQLWKTMCEALLINKRAMYAQCPHPSACMNGHDWAYRVFDLFRSTMDMPKVQDEPMSEDVFVYMWFRVLSDKKRDAIQTAARAYMSALRAEIETPQYRFARFASAVHPLISGVAVPACNADACYRPSGSRLDDTKVLAGDLLDYRCTACPEPRPRARAEHALWQYLAAHRVLGADAEQHTMKTWARACEPDARAAFAAEPAIVKERVHALNEAVERTERSAGIPWLRRPGACSRVVCSGSGKIAERDDYTPEMFGFRYYHNCTDCPNGSTFLPNEKLGMQLWAHVAEVVDDATRTFPSLHADTNVWSDLYTLYTNALHAHPNGAQHHIQTKQMIRAFWLCFYRDAMHYAKTGRWDAFVNSLQSVHTDDTYAPALRAATEANINALPLAQRAKPLPVTSADMPTRMLMDREQRTQHAAQTYACTRCAASPNGPHPHVVHAGAPLLYADCTHIICHTCLVDRLQMTLDVSQLRCHAHDCNDIHVPV
jgi:hypothetical protein